MPGKASAIFVAGLAVTVAVAVPGDDRVVQRFEDDSAPGSWARVFEDEQVEIGEGEGPFREHAKAAAEVAGASPEKAHSKTAATSHRKRDIRFSCCCARLWLGPPRPPRRGFVWRPRRGRPAPVHRCFGENTQNFTCRSDVGRPALSSAATART